MSGIKVQYFTTFNFTDKKDQNENEDAFFEKPAMGSLCFSLSDGAGGVGIFSADWARFLTQRQPETYPDDRRYWHNWFSTAAEAFYEQIDPENNLNDPLVLQKFYSEGSYATLLYVWIDEQKDELTSLAVGDTFLFHFNLNGRSAMLKQIYPLANHHTLDDFPQLLNWNRAIEDWPAPYQAKLEKNDVIICCTDALAKFFIKALFAGNPAAFAGLLSDQLLERLNTQEAKITSIQPLGLLELISDFFNLSGEKQRIDLLRQLVGEGLEEDDYTISCYIHG